jgi:DNA modification methylase
MEQISVTDLHPNPRNARTHSKKQIKQIASSIEAFGFNSPILVGESNDVIAGHGRLQAAKQLGLPLVPVVRLSHLSDTEKRAYVLADNKIALNSGWDTELLSLELGELADLLPESDLDLEITGFETGEIDLIFLDHEEPDPSCNTEDELPPESDVIVSKRGDIWQLGGHRLLCGDARDAAAVGELFAGDSANAVITDPPYNVKVQGHVGGRGKTKHDEFAFASGEMSDDEFRAFLHSSLKIMQTHSEDGALLYLFMDWRHIELLLSAGRKLGLILKNLCVWHKTTPGQGSFYRSSHELVAVFAKPGVAPTNNVQLGRHGRNRTNVWSYAGVNSFQAAKGGDLGLHPTVKPVAMIAEAIKDASKRRDIVFDPFLGSGTAVLAAEKVGRRCFGVEYEPKYVDTAILRWQEMTGKDAVLVRREDTDSDLTAGVGDCFDVLLERARIFKKMPR